MSSHRLLVRCVSFSRENLEREIGLASLATKESAPEDQVRFLFSYLNNVELGAKTILIEHPYVDRHFLEEYTNYYATNLHPPPPKATRLHFFNFGLSHRKLLAKLRQAANGKFDQVCHLLSSGYLGFAVIRPLPDAPLGRTILRTYSSSDPLRPRCYTLPPHSYRVHLCGLKLAISGVPFQQQEQGVGACATTAIWSALAQVMRHDGGRAPTPFAVTEAATKHWVSDRVFPASAGLKDEQILEAFRQFGYSPLSFFPVDEIDNFFMGIKCYLRSGIPVILKLFNPGDREAHAVTLVGFGEGGNPLELIVSNGQDVHYLRSKGLRRLYVHDDRFGAYARSIWNKERTVNKEGKPAGEKILLQYLPIEEGFDKFTMGSEIMAAMVPLYPKIRLSAQDLIGFAGEFLPIFPEILPQDLLSFIRLDLRFALAGDFIEDLYRSKLQPKKISSFARKAVLSRYIGVLRFSIEDNLVAYVICDSTDLRRDAPASAPLLAVISGYDQYNEVFKVFVEKFGRNILVV